MAVERKASSSRTRQWILGVAVIGVLLVSSVRLAIALSPGSGATRGDIILTGVALGAVGLLTLVFVALALPRIFSRKGSARLRARYPDNVVVFASVGSEQASALRAIAVERKYFKTPQGLLVVLASTFIHVWNLRGTRLLICIDPDRVQYAVGEYRTLGRSYPALVMEIVNSGERIKIPLTLNDMRARLVPKQQGADEIAEIVDKLRE